MTQCVNRTPGGISLARGYSITAVPHTPLLGVVAMTSSTAHCVTRWCTRVIDGATIVALTR